MTVVVDDAIGATGEIVRRVRQRDAADLEQPIESIVVAAGVRLRKTLGYATLVGAAIAILFMLQAAFQSVRLAGLMFLTLPVALVGGVLAAWIAVGTISLGALVGFFAVLGIAARNGILMISHLQHLEREEGEPFGLGLVLRGAGERLSPILMTALATALALAPLVIFGDRPGQEIENPMASVILGGLATSTVMNLFVLPALYLRFGASSRVRDFTVAALSLQSASRPTGELLAVSGELPRSGREVQDQVHQPYDQGCGYQGPEAVDVKAAHQRLGEYEHQHRHEEPRHPQGEDGKRKGHQPHQRLEHRVEHPEHRGGRKQRTGALDIHAAEPRRDHREHQRIGEPGDPKSRG